MAKIVATPNVGEDTEKLDPRTQLMGCNVAQQFWNRVPNMPSSHGPETVPLGVYPRQMKTPVLSKALFMTSVFVRDLLIIAPNCEQPRCPVMSEQLSQLCSLPCGTPLSREKE